MTSPNSRGAQRDTGAVRDGTRKKGLLPLFLLLGLLALIALALILYFSLRGGSKKTAAVAPIVPPSTTATPLEGGSPQVSSSPVDTASPATAPSPADTSVATASPAATASPEATISAAVSPTAAAATTITLNGGLVGGGSVAPKPATGTLAAGDTAGTILFAENSAALTANADQVIADAAKAIKADHPAKIYVSGYTDSIAGQPANTKLSSERAAAVLAQLKAAVGSSGTVYATRDHGESDPVATNTTAAGRQQNRRATITTD